MVGFFDFKKKQQTTQQSDQGQVGYQQQTTTTTVSQAATQPDYPGAPQSYNGIGNAPQRQ